MAFSDDLNAHLQKNEHLAKIEPFWEANVDSDHVTKKVSYANALSAPNNSRQNNVVMSNVRIRPTCCFS